MIQVEKKTELVAKFRTHEKDTGSPEVQVAILSERNFATNSVFFSTWII